MLRFKWIIGTCLVATVGLNAQQLPLFAQYRNAHGLINPAALYSEFFLFEYDLNVNASYRGQWLTQAESPRTLQAQAEYITDFGGNFEWVTGLNLIKDQTGPLGLQGTYGRLGVTFSEDPYYGAFVLGFSAGFVNYRLNATEIRWAQPDDPNIPLLNEAFTKPDLGVGAFYHRRVGSGRFSRNHIYVGLSVPQILNARYQLSGEEETTVAIDRTAHYYLTAGWYHFYNQDAFIELSSWAKYVNGAPFNADLNVRWQTGRYFWLALGYNISSVVHLETGVNITDYLGSDTNLQLSFSYNGSFKALGYDLGGSYEFGVSTQFATR